MTKVVDNDGDKALVVKDKLLTRIAKRNMVGIVPLYYEMKKAKGGQLNSFTLFQGMIKAYTGGNIGPYSNNITKNWNSGLVDEQAINVIKWLCMENNFCIDCAKTLYMPIRPKHIDEIIKFYTKAKLPNFFIYAKDKESHQVEMPNNSTMNRIAASIPDPKIKFSKTISKFDYRMLMNLDCDFSISPESSVVKAYDYWNARQNLFNEEDSNQKDQDLFKYKQIREKIINETQKDLDYIVNTLIAVLYTTRKASAKKTLWACFGDVILENLKKNINGKGKICQICGKRFEPKRMTQNYCSEDCYGIAKRQREIERFCHKEM